MMDKEPGTWAREDLTDCKEENEDENRIGKCLYPLS